MTRKDKIISFVLQHVLLFIALYIMTLGISLCVKSMLGASVISVLPYAFYDAGTDGLTPALTIGQYTFINDAGTDGLTPALTIGQYTFIMNALLVVGQVGVLRRQFDPVQLFQLLVGFVFGMLIDLNMHIISWLQPTAFFEKAISQFAGCTILAIGVAGRYLTSSSRHYLLLYILRKMAMAHHWGRYIIRNVLCRMGRTYYKPSSEMVRPSAQIPSRIQKVHLRFGKIHLQKIICSQIYD